ncbi:glycoside hydrolase family 61 protein [Apiospora phragmitis]|uniref:lytic cellulose monooxygenase (C4-dehydrogenating) n=1 Tax=Apiospora phragmitis TaxID=2905665 RepID=A0ABR1SR41_9PEZI
MSVKPRTTRAKARKNIVFILRWPLLITMRQFFQACAQLSVSGSGTREFPGVHLPGAYSENDPGIHVNLWWPVPTNYTNPGPLPIQC